MAAFTNKDRARYENIVGTYAQSVGRQRPTKEVFAALDDTALLALAARCQDYTRFGREVDIALTTPFNRFSAVMVRNNTPKVLQDLGCPNLAMLHTKKHIRDEVHPKEPGHPEYHGLTLNQVKLFAELLDRPCAVIDNNANKTGLICVLDALDAKGLPIVMPFKPNGNGQYLAQPLQTNFILSVYGKTGFSNYLAYAEKENRLLFIDNRRIKRLLTKARLPLPGSCRNLNGILRQTSKVVKPPTTTKTPDESAGVRITQEKEEQIMAEQTKTVSASTAPIDPDVVISVYVANLGKYNEGEMVGGWIDLPVTDEELNTFLTDTVGLSLTAEQAAAAGERGERVYEEPAIHDYDFENGLELLGYKPDEYTNLSDLNLLAKCMQVAAADHANFDAVKAYLDNEGHSLSPLQFANVVAQADEIPFYAYDLPENMTMADCSSLSEALGYDLAFKSFPDVLETSIGYDTGLTVENYFNFEEYGRDIATNYLTLTDEGYLDYWRYPSPIDYYDRKELVEEIASQWDYTLVNDDDSTPSLAPEADLDASTDAHVKEQEPDPSISPASSKENAARAAALRNGQPTPGRANPAR